MSFKRDIGIERPVMRMVQLDMRKSVKWATFWDRIGFEELLSRIWEWLRMFLEERPVPW